MISISIIIPTFNRKAVLFNTLNQINEQINKINKIQFNIVIVEDGSSDGTFEMLENDFPQIHIVKGTGNWWYTKSMNEGFKYAKKFNPDYILAINDDIILENKYICNLLSSINNVEKNSIIGSFSYIQSTPPRVFFSGIKIINKITYKQYKYLKSQSEINPKEISGLFPSKTLPGRGMLIPFRVLRELNYFDEFFPQYGSDDDFVLRAWENGYKAYVSYDAKIIALPELTSNGAPLNKISLSFFLKNMFFNKYSSTYFCNNVRMIYKHGNKWFFPFTILYQLFATIYSYFKYTEK